MTVDLERVLRDLAPRLYRYAIGRIGDAALAEDVAQECLTALVQRWQRHGPPESAEAFVFAIARRRAFRAAVRRHFGPLLDDLDPALLPLEEPKSTLQEWAQRRGLALPAYREIEVRGPAHARLYIFEVALDGEVLARGEGSSKRAAQQDAARHALERLET